MHIRVNGKKAMHLYSLFIDSGYDREPHIKNTIRKQVEDLKAPPSCVSKSSICSDALSNDVHGQCSGS